MDSMAKPADGDEAFASATRMRMSKRPLGDNKVISFIRCEETGRMRMRTSRNSGSGRRSGGRRTRGWARGNGGSVVYGV
eukprot:4535641-Pleurochrysis_carterae.AAC.4